MTGEIGIPAGLTDIHLEHSRRVAEEKKRIEAELTQQRLVGEYGRPLGDAFFSYVHGVPQTFEQLAKTRRAFAEALVSTFEEGTPAEKVRAVTAFLDAVDTRAAKASTSRKFGVTPLVGS